MLDPRPDAEGDPDPNPAPDAGPNPDVVEGCEGALSLDPELGESDLYVEPDADPDRDPNAGPDPDPEVEGELLLDALAPSGCLESLPLTFK